MSMMRLGIAQKIFAMAAVITIVLLIILIGSNYIGQQQTLFSSEKRQLETYNDVFWGQVDSDAKSFEKLLHVLTLNDDLVTTFQNGDRDLLLEKSKPIFETIKSQHDITHFYFIDKDGKVFLRVHNPPKHGDTLKRATFIQARDNGKLGQGIEMGKKYFSLRVVMPVKRNGEIVGYFELGEELDHFVKNFKKLTKSDISIWVSENYAQNKKLTSVFEKIDNWYRVMASDEEQQNQLLKIASKNINNSSSYHFTSSFENNDLSVQTFPFKDAFGEVAGMIMIANDVTELTDEFSSLILKVIVVAVIMLIILSILTIWVSRSIVRPLQKARDMMHDISEGEGDLTVRLQIKSNDEVGELANSFNRFVEKLHHTISEVASSSIQLGEASNSLNGSSLQSSRIISRQRDETQQVATSVNEMAATIQEVANNANEAANAADLADQKSIEGRNVVMQTIGAIKNLAEDVEHSAQVISRLKGESENIGSVLDVIKGIAEQTNLLALNAAIEAARAGEQGRGFAVVADEVRTLAQRTQESTQEIEQMIDSLQVGANEAESVMEQSRQRAQDTVDQASQAGSSLDSITSSVTTIRNMNTQIATASVQQTAVADELNRTINSINDISEESEQQSSIILNACDELSRMGEKLKTLVGQFRT